MLTEIGLNQSPFLSLGNKFPEELPFLFRGGSIVRPPSRKSGAREGRMISQGNHLLFLLFPIRPSDGRILHNRPPKGGKIRIVTREFTPYGMIVAKKSKLFLYGDLAVFRIISPFAILMATGKMHPHEVKLLVPGSGALKTRNENPRAS
jgi:hypothetical protein